MAPKTTRLKRSFTVMTPLRYMRSTTTKTPRVAPTACRTIPL